MILSVPWLCVVIVKTVHIAHTMSGFSTTVIYLLQDSMGSASRVPRTAWWTICTIDRIAVGVDSHQLE